MSQELYSLLKEGESREIPWHVAAEHLLKLKVASGGLLPEDIEELQEEAEKIKSAGTPIEPITREEIARSLKRGYLSGVRSTVSGDMRRRSLVRRKRGERAGKTLGSLAGAAGGALIGGKKNRMAGAALGTVLGYTGGKAIGEETDYRRMSNRLRRKKSAAIEKTSDFGKEAEEKRKSPTKALLTGAGIGAALAGGREAYLMAPGLKNLGDALGKNAPVRSYLGTAARSGRAVGAALGGAGAGALTAAGIYGVREKMRQRKAALEKKAQEATTPAIDESIPVEAPVVPQIDPMQEEAAASGKQDPVDLLLQAQQAANEAEFFQQKAEEAEAAAEQESERAEMAEEQLQQANETAEQQTQESSVREQQAGQQAQVATQQAQMASQDSVQAREESLQAQQANIELRQAVTNFRQSLMDLVAQDPTQTLGPPAVPQGPMPMGPGGGGPPPGPEGMPPGPPPEQGGPVPGAGPPPGGMPPPPGPEGMPPPGGMPPPPPGGMMPPPPPGGPPPGPGGKAPKPPTGAPPSA